jgi:methylphosphotriester-DNA--protein-cysteine methyltransferase
MTARTYTLLGPDRQPYQSATSGALGGHRPGRVYGRLDCPAALRAIARGRYVRNRVFFADEQTAVAAGYRPCAVCLPGEYAQWKAAGLSEWAQQVPWSACLRGDPTDIRLEGEASRKVGSGSSGIRTRVLALRGL